MKNKNRIFYLFPISLRISVYKKTLYNTIKCTVQRFYIFFKLTLTIKMVRLISVNKNKKQYQNVCVLKYRFINNDSYRFADEPTVIEANTT